MSGPATGPVLYLDSSALVKLYVVEADSAIARGAAKAAPALGVTTTAYAETRSALARRLREGGLSPSEHSLAVADLGADWAVFERLEVRESLGRAAGVLAQTHGLRGYDAVHLAAALWFHTQGPGVSFLTFDKRLEAAARAARVPVWTP